MKILKADYYNSNLSKYDPFKPLPPVPGWGGTGGYYSAGETNLFHICPTAGIKKAGIVNHEDSHVTRWLGGIEWFAFVCRHENQHRMNFVSFWPDGYKKEEDEDEDLIPDTLEPILWGLDPKKKNTHPHPLNIPDYDDFEYINYIHHYKWYDEIKNADFEKYDWSYPGKQTIPSE